MCRTDAAARALCRMEARHRRRGAAARGPRGGGRRPHRCPWRGASACYLSRPVRRAAGRHAPRLHGGAVAPHRRHRRVSGPGARPRRGRGGRPSHRRRALRDRQAARHPGHRDGWRPRPGPAWPRTRRRGSYPTADRGRRRDRPRPPVEPWRGLGRTVRPDAAHGPGRRCLAAGRLPTGDGRRGGGPRGARDGGRGIGAPRGRSLQRRRDLRIALGRAGRRLGLGQRAPRHSGPQSRRRDRCRIARGRKRPSATSSPGRCCRTSSPVSRRSSSTRRAPAPTPRRTISLGPACRASSRCPATRALSRAMPRRWSPAAMRSSASPPSTNSATRPMSKSSPCSGGTRLRPEGGAFCRETAGGHTISVYFLHGRHSGAREARTQNLRPRPRRQSIGVIVPSPRIIVFMGSGFSLRAPRNDMEQTDQSEIVSGRIPAYESPHEEGRLFGAIGVLASDRAGAARQAPAAEAGRARFGGKVPTAGRNVVAVRPEGPDRAGREAGLSGAARAGRWGREPLWQVQTLGESERPPIAVPQTEDRIDEQADRRRCGGTAAQRPGLKRMPGRPVEGKQSTAAGLSRQPLRRCGATTGRGDLRRRPTSRRRRRKPAIRRDPRSRGARPFRPACRSRRRQCRHADRCGRRPATQGRGWPRVPRSGRGSRCRRRRDQIAAIEQDPNDRVDVLLERRMVVRS